MKDDGQRRATLAWRRRSDRCPGNSCAPFARSSSSLRLRSRRGLPFASNVCVKLERKWLKDSYGSTTERHDVVGIALNAFLRGLAEKDEYEGVAGFGPGIPWLPGYFSGNPACILRDHLADAVALEGHLLSGVDLIIELDQTPDEAACMPLLKGAPLDPHLLPFATDRRGIDG